MEKSAQAESILEEARQIVENIPIRKGGRNPSVYWLALWLRLDKACPEVKRSEVQFEIMRTESLSKLLKVFITHFN